MPIVLVSNACPATADDPLNLDAPESFGVSAGKHQMGLDSVEGSDITGKGLRSAYALVMMEGTAMVGGGGGGGGRWSGDGCSYARLVRSLQERGARGVVISAPAGVEVEELTCRCVLSTTSQVKSCYRALHPSFRMISIGICIPCMS